MIWSGGENPPETRRWGKASVVAVLVRVAAVADDPLELEAASRKVEFEKVAVHSCAAVQHPVGVPTRDRHPEGRGHSTT
jgi:hypothetical protein